MDTDRRTPKSMGVFLCQRNYCFYWTKSISLWYIYPFCQRVSIVNDGDWTDENKQTKTPESNDPHRHTLTARIGFSKKKKTFFFQSKLYVTKRSLVHSVHLLSAFNSVLRACRVCVCASEIEKLNGAKRACGAARNEYICGPDELDRTSRMNRSGHWHAKERQREGESEWLF